MLINSIKPTYNIRIDCCLEDSMTLLQFSAVRNFAFSLSVYGYHLMNKLWPLHQGNIEISSLLKNATFFLLLQAYLLVAPFSFCLSCTHE